MKKVQEHDNKFLKIFYKKKTNTSSIQISEGMGHASLYGGFNNNWSDEDDDEEEEDGD